MTGVNSTFALQRAQRAAVARVLLQLHEQDALDKPEQWSWQALTEFPAWCLLGSEERTQLQLVCGAVALGPSLRLWLDRLVIAEGHRLVGTECFECILSEAQGINLHASEVPALDDALLVVPTPDDVETRFMTTGAAVMRATLGSSLSLNSVVELLGETSCTIPPQAALAYLHYAERLLAEADSPSVEDATSVTAE